MVPPFVVVSPFPPREWASGGKHARPFAAGQVPAVPETGYRVLGRRTMRRLAASKEPPVNKPERLASAAAAAEFQVGGVRMWRPFRIRRLGHFGVNVADPEKSKDFYCRLLGFRISDPIDFGPRLPEDKRASVGTTVGYFSRHGTDHHSFVFFPKGAYAILNPHSLKPSGTINQITWQVGSLQEVSDAFDWFTRRGKQIRRAGRDLPGSNWHFYPPDPDGHTNELYYGIEQIGWDGYSKPREMYGVRYTKPPQLPHRSEYAEVMQATDEGIPIEKGIRSSCARNCDCAPTPRSCRSDCSSAVTSNCATRSRS